MSGAASVGGALGTCLSRRVSVCRRVSMAWRVVTTSSRAAASSPRRRLSTAVRFSFWVVMGEASGREAWAEMTTCGVRTVEGGERIDKGLWRDPGVHHVELWKRCHAHLLPIPCSLETGVPHLVWVPVRTWQAWHAALLLTKVGISLSPEGPCLKLQNSLQTPLYPDQITKRKGIK